MYTNDFQNCSRGVLIYVQNTIKSKQLYYEKPLQEVVTVEIEGQKDTLTICNIYRSPNSPEDNNKCLNNFIENLATKTSGKLLVVGDFNYNDIIWENGTAKSAISNNFIEVLREHFLIQNVVSPTRGRGTDEPHLLDLVITNDSFIEHVEHMAPLGKSDHCILNIKCNCKVQLEQFKPRLDFEKGNYEAFKNYLAVDWVTTLETHKGDINGMWNLFKDRIIEGTNQFVPPVKNLSDIKKKWIRPIDAAVRSEIKCKNKLWKRYLKSKDKAILEEYKHTSNRVRKQTRAINKEEQLKIAKSCKTNPKKFWNYIKSKTNSKDKIGDLVIVEESKPDRVISDNQEKANILCDYFSSVFNKDAGKEDLYGANKCDNNMEGISLSTEDIMKRLGDLNVFKSSGPDMLHPRVLKEVREVIALPLKIIFEESLISGVLPLDWRSGNISPIFKKGSKTRVENYRPISLTCVVCKILESIIRDKLVKHMKDNNLFSVRQYGFIKGRSTVSQLLKILDKWTDYLENGGQIDAIYTDLEKAFDKVPHRSLLNKLRWYKIDNNVISWIGSFLTNRLQRVRLEDSFSSWAKVLSGIPQGTILGPLLFLIYINDIMDVCKESELFVYADDAKLFSHINSAKDVITLQNDLNVMNNWIKEWSLKLNIDKCRIVSYGRSSNIIKYDYFIGNAIIERTESITDLGVVFDQQLKFGLHIREKVNKAYARLGIIKRNFKCMSIEVFCLLYKAMVRSQLEYANSVWNPHNKEDIEIIEKVQMRATKLVESVKHLSYEDRLKKLGIPTLKYRRLRGDLIEVFKIITNKDNNSNCILTLHKDLVTRGNRYKLYQKHVNYDLRKYFFANRIITVWNSLPDNVVSSSSVNLFKNRLDYFLHAQDIYFNWKADLTGTGDRSEHHYETSLDHQ